MFYIGGTQKRGGLIMYKLIYADPPWSYNNKASNGAADKHYDTLTMNELKQMRVDLDQLADPDSVIALWVVSPMLPDCIKVMESWGFHYKTLLFNWHKLTVNGLPFFGTGNYTRAGSELLLLGVKGKGVKRIAANIRQVVNCSVRQHSRKPDEIRDMLVLLFGDVPRIELFARSQHTGWDNFGDETKKFDVSEIDLSFLE